MNFHVFLYVFFYNMFSIYVPRFLEPHAKHLCTIMSIGCLDKGNFYTNSDLAYQSAPVCHSHFHQVENEYGAFGYGDFPRDLKYLEFVKEQLLQNGVVELFFTSDSPRYSEDMGALPGGMSNAKLVPRNADVSSRLLARTHEHAYVPTGLRTCARR